MSADFDDADPDFTRFLELQGAHRLENSVSGSPAGSLGEERYVGVAVCDVRLNREALSIDIGELILELGGPSVLFTDSS